MKSHGISAGEVVGVHCHRGVDVVAGIIAIWKVGAIYLPLELNLPHDRMTYMLEDSKTAAILTSHKIDIKSAYQHLPVVSVDGYTASELDRVIPYSLDVTRSDQEMAYLIYTSGSTGQPKGVLVSHRDFVSHCFAIQSEFEITDQDKVLVFPSLGFDPSLEYMIPALITGGSIYLREDKVWSPAEYAEVIVNKGLSVAYTPTPLLAGSDDRMVQVVP